MLLVKQSGAALVWDTGVAYVNRCGPAWANTYP